VRERLVVTISQGQGFDEGSTRVLLQCSTVRERLVVAISRPKGSTRVLLQSSTVQW
jgi:hypothetical protein